MVILSNVLLDGNMTPSAIKPEGITGITKDMVMSAKNALTFDLDLMVPVAIQGAGAGKTETGHAILRDVLAIHHDLR